MPLAVPIPTNPAVAVAVVVDAGDEPVMVGASGHIGRHWPQNSDRACLQGASLTLAEAERGGRARDCCPGWVCHHPNLRRRCGQEQRETTRQPRCSTRVRRGAKPRGRTPLQVPDPSAPWRETFGVPHPSQPPSVSAHHSGAKTRAPAGECFAPLQGPNFRATVNQSHARPGRAQPTDVPSANAHAPTPPAQLGRSPDGPDEERRPWTTTETTRWDDSFGNNHAEREI